MPIQRKFDLPRRKSNQARSQTGNPCTTNPGIESIFDLGNSGGSNIAKDKRAMIAEAVEAEAAASVRRESTQSGGPAMATNLAIDDQLIDEARRAGNHATDEDAVAAALQQYVRWRKQLQILEHFGTIDHDPTYDYKKMRKLDRIPEP